MHVVNLVVFFSILLPKVWAWLPGEHKTIVSFDGVNRFKSTPGYHRNDSRVKRWLPSSGKIRGVNLGSLFVLEPWMASTEWSSMGCGSAESEFDCVSALGQSKANSVFQSHWGSWITENDISQMSSYGLNTIRIPVGYWMYESIVYTSEHFPQGGLAYLEKVCGWASNYGFYIIIDMHGAPGAQVSENPDTGQYAPTPGFYVDYQFNRGLQFISWLTTKIHSNANFRNVGMLAVVNEPVQDASTAATMISSYYPSAYNAIRTAESKAGVADNNKLHVEMMNELWGAGDPTQSLTDTHFTAYDDHRYLKYDTSVNVSHSAYIAESCNDNRNSDNETPTIVGEWSLSVPDNVQFTSAWSTSTQQSFYSRWFAAQVMSYEAHTSGWIFWSWKTQLGDYRWSYSEAVTAGVIPSNLDDLDRTACNGY